MINYDNIILPDKWIISNIIDVCDIYTGYGFPEKLQGRKEGEIPFYKVGDISEAWKVNQVYLDRANNYIDYSDLATLHAKTIPANTTVFAKIGAAIALNRRTILAKPSLVDNNVMGLRPKIDSLDYKYLYYYTCTLKLDELSRATTVPSLRKSDIQNIKIPIPPIEVQTAIVSEIEKQFTRLDAGVAALKRLQINLKRYRASVLKAACEGKLVPTEAELARQEGRDYEPASVLLERILKERREKWMEQNPKKKYVEPKGPDTSNLPELPEGWCWSSLDQLSLLITDGDHNPPPRVEKGIPHLTAKNIKSSKIDFNDCTYISENNAERVFKRYKPKAGDLIITCVGTIGRTAIVPPDVIFSPDRNLAAIRLVISEVFVEYIETYINSPDSQEVIKNVSGSTAQPHLYLGDLKTFSVVIPPYCEVERIINEIQDKLSVIDALESLINKNYKRAERLKQTVLQKEFEG